jgi:myo-inositol-1(or 4)-monophosphatase
MLAWADRLTAEAVDAKDGGNDLVTAADSEIEALVRHHLAARRPGDTMVGEEGAAARALADVEGGARVVERLTRAAEAASAARAGAGSAGDCSVSDAVAGRGKAGSADTGSEDAGAEAESLVWHVDPIDGTVNFVRSIEHFCFSVGVRLASADPASPDDGWVAGLVAAPLLDRVWFAVDGRAWAAPLSALEDPTAAVRELDGGGAPSSGRVVATGFGYAPERRAVQLEALGRVMEDFDDVRRCGSAAIDLCMAAEGRVNAYYERGLGVYDYAGGAYVAQCAGRFVHRRADSFLREDTGATIQPPAAAAVVEAAAEAETSTGADEGASAAQPAPELTVVADTRERFELLLARG